MNNIISGRQLIYHDNQWINMNLLQMINVGQAKDSLFKLLKIIPFIPKTSYLEISKNLMKILLMDHRKYH